MCDGTDASANPSGEELVHVRVIKQLQFHLRKLQKGIPRERWQGDVVHWVQAIVRQGKFPEILEYISQEQHID